MVGVFWAEMALHLSPKYLELSAGISGTVFGQSGLGLWIVFEWSGAELPCLFWAVLR